MSGRDEGPVYYREIQKNAYLKRIPDEYTSKLRPLVQKKCQLKPMWTLFCVHNGKTPYLEQYQQQESSVTHRPSWRACLKTARHVTASVTSHSGQEYDFLIDTDNGPVRMLAPDWESMQDWVVTLRSKLHELRILSRGENVYGAGPVAAVPRAPARDPTSPLPPTPPVPPDRVPGIELTPIRPNTEAHTSIESSNSLHTTQSGRAMCTVEAAGSSLGTAANSSYTHSSVSNSSAASTVGDSVNNTFRNVSTVNSSAFGASTVANSGIGPLSYVNVSISTIADTNSLLTSTFGNTSNPSTVNINSHSTDADTNSTFTSKPLGTVANTNSAFIRESLGTVANTNSSFTSTLANSSKPLGTVANENSSFTCTVANTNKSLGTVANTNSFKSTLANTSKTLGTVANTNSFTSTLANTSKTLGTVANTNSFTSTLANTSKTLGTVADTFTNFSLERALNAIDRAEIDISSWDEKPIASTNQKITKAKICGQNICLDDSVLKRTAFDEDSASDASENDVDFTQMLTVNDSGAESIQSPQQSNVTVIKVSNKEPPHTATPVLSDDTEVFDFNFKQKLAINETKPDIVIINTNDRYGAIFQPEPEYGHISLTTTVSLTGENKMAAAGSNEGVYERLCMASTSNASPLSVRRLEADKSRKSSLPNLETEYECLFPSDNNRLNGDNSNDVSNNIERRVNVERSRSQNAYDLERENVRKGQNDTKRDAKSEKEAHKPIWRRGLTELSLLTRLKSLKQGRRQDPPPACGGSDRVSSPQKVVRRARNENRVDSGRRRSNSFSNGEVPPGAGLVPLRARQAAALRAEQTRGACVAAVPLRDPPLFVDHDNRVWIARWGGGGARCGGRAGDALAALGAVQPTGEHHARQIINSQHKHTIDVLFYRVPLAKIYVINKNDHELIGIKLDSECTIQSVEPNSPASRVGFPPGKWAVTEVNNRPINLIKGGEEEMNRLSARGTEVSVLIQPSGLVKKLRAAIKGSRPLLGIR